MLLEPRARLSNGNASRSKTFFGSSRFDTLRADHQWMPANIDLQPTAAVDRAAAGEIWRLDDKDAKVAETMNWWTDLDVLNRMVLWLTVLTVASPFVFGLATLAVQSRAKKLEDQRVETLRAANRDLQQDLGESKRAQETLRGHLLDLEKEQQGRALTPGQVDSLAAKLRTPALSNRWVYVEAPQGDREAIQLAASIKHALELAGCQVDGVQQHIRVGGLGPGIQIWHKSDERLAGAALKEALAAVGLAAKLLEITKADEQSPRVIVGYRP